MSELNRELLNQILSPKRHEKTAYAPPNPVAPPAGAAPPMPPGMDPAAAGGMPMPPMPPGMDPAMMDPAAAGGMPPMPPGMDPAMMDPAAAGGMPMDPSMMDPAAMAAALEGAMPADPAAGGMPPEMSPDAPIQVTLEDLRSLFTEIVTGEPAVKEEPVDMETRVKNIEEMLSQLTGGDQPEAAPLGGAPEGPGPMEGDPMGGDPTGLEGVETEPTPPGMEGFTPEVQKMAAVTYESKMSAADWEARERLTKTLAHLSRVQ